MFNNLTLKATLRAEKDKEVIDTRRAGRYVKIRALLDSAESAIRSSNITRSLQNNLVGKVMRARKALDFGMNVPQVAENMALVVATLEQEIIEDQMAIDSINTDLRKDLDTFYNYDFEKFVELDKKEKERYDPRGTRRGRRFSKSESSIDLGNEKSVSENDSKVENEHDPAENVKSGQDLTPKVSNVDGKSGDENADPIEDVWTINQTVDTETTRTIPFKCDNIANDNLGCSTRFMQISQLLSSLLWCFDRFKVDFSTEGHRSVVENRKGTTDHLLVAHLVKLIRCQPRKSPTFKSSRYRNVDFEE
ncbi:unnamed protein product [Nesidiocoris tenuis]|uniref:Uncharacterized protein n=1 Tax=Nesidiocoris tenuis TaxID=355587 RepID=A0A6H5HGP9_9HEMI|nr:unnamed protein product [Nesidiocoris tenuis]